MIGGADENEPEAQPSNRTATPPSPPSPPIAPPSSPLQATGLERRLLGSIRALALARPAPPPAAAPKVGLGLLLHLRPEHDHPRLDPATPSASPSPSASEDPLEEDAAAARPHAAAGPRSPLLLEEDAAATSAPTNTMFRQWADERAPHLLQHLGPAVDTAGDHESGLVDGQQAEEFRAGDKSRPTHVASPSEDESIATVISSASEEDDPLEDAAEWPHAAHVDAGAGLYLPVNIPCWLGDAAAMLAPCNTMFGQWDAKTYPHLLQYLKPDTGGDLALEDHAAAGDGREEKVLQQCTGDQLRAATDDQEVVRQGAIQPRDETACGIAAEDQEKVGSAENGDVVEGQRKGEGTDGTAAEDPDKAVAQCDTYGLGTTENGDAEDDREAVEQCVIDKESAAMDDNAVKDHEVVGPTVMDGMNATIDDMCAEYQEKKVEQCATYDLETIENDDAVEDQEVVEQGVVSREGLTIDDDDSVEDDKAVEQSIIEGMPVFTDDIAVEDQKVVVEQCAVHEPRATKDEYIVEEKEKVVEQGVIDKQGATNMDVAVKDHDKLMKQQIIDNQGTVHMDAIVVKDHDKAVTQYASDAIITDRDDNFVKERNKVGDQSVIDENGRTKDDIDVKEHGYLKEQVIVDNWGTFSDAAGLEDLKNEAELCKGDELIAGNDMYVVHMKGGMLEQRTGKLGATKSDFTVEKHKDVVERVCHEWGAPDDDLAIDTAASQSIREVSSSEVVSATANGSDGGTWKKDKVKLPIRYPQRPRKLNCPFYMSSGGCSYGFSCQFHHPPLKAKPDGSWCPSEQGNHGVAEILELNRIGLPIRRGARNCTYYMRNSACRYGKHCHFNHPEHVIDAQFYTPTGWEDNALQLEKSSDHTTLDDTSHLKKSSDNATLDDTSYSKKSSDHATLDDTSYSKKSSGHAILDDTSSSSEILPRNILRMLLPLQKVLPSREGKVMQVKKDSDWSATSDDSDGCYSADSSDGPLCKQEHVDNPERPGRPECKYPTRYHLVVPSLGGEQTEYPERLGEPECPFYMKSRFCKFGAQCRFNHPKDSNPTMQSPRNAKISVATNEHHHSTRIKLEDHMPQQQQYPERPGQPDCRYYLQFGECKFLSACIFHHPRDGLPVGWNHSGPAHSDQIEPETHDMPECPFYIKTGKCQFGSACEFRHPKDICSSSEGAVGRRTDLAYDNFTRPENLVQKQEHTMYPERPGEPQCFEYTRHGSCRKQMNCKYHHPADQLSRKQYDSTYH